MTTSNNYLKEKHPMFIIKPFTSRELTVYPDGTVVIVETVSYVVVEVF